MERGVLLSKRPVESTPFRHFVTVATSPKPEPNDAFGSVEAISKCDESYRAIVAA